jgi:predicted ATPase
MIKIDKVKIKNFKSLRDIDMSLSNLTLITGVNSSGKSSFIQTLLLLKQNEMVFDNKFRKILSINGEYVELGNKKDILFEDAYEEDIEIVLSSNENEERVLFNNNNLKLSDESNMSLFKESEMFNLFNDDFQYIMTDRAVPSITYRLSDEQVERNLIGFKGEFTAHYLAERRHDVLNIEALKHPNSITNRFLENVSHWLGEISHNIDISAEVNPAFQQVNLTYQYTYGENRTQKYTPLNVGFGITYVLPIIVAVLKAKEGDLLIIENPESHLHPAGQSKIAELCAIASSNGVQIIVETHSDHFLNGIRVATKNGLLTPEQSSVYYFRKDKDELETKIDEINIDKDGGIDRYPKGFFDQFDDDLDALLGL